MGLGPALPSSNNIMKLILTLPLALISLRDWSQRTSGLASWQLSFPSRSRWPKIDWPVPWGRERERRGWKTSGLHQHHQVVFIDYSRRDNVVYGYLEGICQPLRRLLHREFRKFWKHVGYSGSLPPCGIAPWCLKSKVAINSTHDCLFSTLPLPDLGGLT